jgi:virulence-associated protein VagC
MIKMKVKKQGLLIPKEFFMGIQEVEIRQEAHTIVVIPLMAADPILQLGTTPLDDAIIDASINHDQYLYTL